MSMPLETKSAGSFYGIDRDYVAAVTAKARRERNAALRAMVAGLFGSVADKREAEEADARKREAAVLLCAGRVAHL